jgi:ABC-type branched-subunit amino acid transport system ATPase component
MTSARDGGRALPDLKIEGLLVRFGGRTAVDELTLHAGAGVVTGLIGPNGAGKTTTFDATTGIVRPAAGSVWLGDDPLHGKPTAYRARIGLGRTFQRTELCGSMTVAENVALGPECALAGRSWWRQLLAPGSQRNEIRERTDQALDLCGIRHLADRPAAGLSTGQRRLVELARVVATRFRFLLLDEPSSGLDEEETAHFAEILLAVLRRDGTGILLVEHDMTLVRALCSKVYVLDFGRLIHHGDTDEVLASPVVRSAYFGVQVV